MTAAATAHQNERWDGVTPERIRTACGRLRQLLREADIGLAVFPCAEVMVAPQTEAAWRDGPGPASRTTSPTPHDKPLKLWDLQAGKEIRTFYGHRQFVTAVAFDPEGSRLASSSEDGSVKVW